MARFLGRPGGDAIVLLTAENGPRTAEITVTLRLDRDRARWELVTLVAEPADGPQTVRQTEAPAQ